MLPSEEIKEKVNIVDVIGETVRLKKAGVNYRGLCPFHQEKTPSFMVSPVKQIWHCFGCGLGGTVFEFVKLTEGVEFREALEMLAARAGIELKKYDGPAYSPDKKKILYDINNWAALYYQKVLAESKAAEGAREYLQRRGLKAETIKQWQIGYAPESYHAFEEFIVKKGYTKQEAVEAGLLIKRDQSLRSTQGDINSYFDRFHGRVVFPLFDVHGRVVGFTGRIVEANNPPPAPAEATAGRQSPLSLRGEVKTAAKYVNSPETLIYSKSRLIYGLNFAKTEIRKQDSVIIVEGNVDVITCHEAGFSNVVGSSGTALTAMQFESLKRFTENVSFALDADEAGLAAMRRAVDLALATGFNVKIISIPKDLAKDPDELIRKDPNKWVERAKEAQNFLDFYFDRVFATMDLQSNTGKKQARDNIVPLLSLLPDSIDRVHYSQKLALAIQVTDQEVLDTVNKYRAEKSKQINPIKPAPSNRRKTKQELLEERVLGLLLKFPEEFAGEIPRLNAADFTVPAHQAIFRRISGDTAPERAGLDTEIDLLVFALENEIALTPGWSLASMKQNFLGQFHLQSLKRRMQAVAAAIRAAESAGQAERVRELSSEFNHLSAELSKFYIPAQ